MKTPQQGRHQHRAQACARRAGGSEGWGQQAGALLWPRRGPGGSAGVYGGQKTGPRGAMESGGGRRAGDGEWRWAQAGARPVHSWTQPHASHGKESGGGTSVLEPSLAGPRTRDPRAPFNSNGSRDSQSRTALTPPPCLGAGVPPSKHPRSQTLAVKLYKGKPASAAQAGLTTKAENTSLNATIPFPGIGRTQAKTWTCSRQDNAWSRAPRRAVRSRPPASQRAGRGWRCGTEPAMPAPEHPQRPRSGEHQQPG